MAAYIKIGDIKGECKAKNYEEWIDISSISHGASRPSNPGGKRDSGSVMVNNIVVTKEGDKSSPKLFEAVCDGTVFKEVEIHICASHGEGERVPVYMWKLTKARVADWNLSGSGDSGNVHETLNLTYEKIDWTYDEIDKDGNSQGKVDSSWKVEEGTA